MSIENENPNVRSLQNLVTSYENKLGDFQVKTMEVKKLDEKIQGLGFFKRKPVEAQKKRLEKEIELLDTEISMEKPGYLAAKSALKQLKKLST